MFENILYIDTNIPRFNQESVRWKLHGVTAERANNMEEAMLFIGILEFFAIVIDGDHIPYKHVIHSLLSKVNFPIIVLTDYFSSDENISVLESGVTYYASWLNDAALSAKRTLAFIKNVNGFNDKITSLSGYITFYGIEIYTKEIQVIIDQNPVKLSLLEFKMLFVFVTHPFQALTKDQLYHLVWGFDEIVQDNNALWSTIKRLRKILQRANAIKVVIETVRGVGYRLNTEKQYEL